MRPPAFDWPHAMAFWVVYAWAFAPELRILQRARARQPSFLDRGSLRTMSAALTTSLLLAFPLAFIDRWAIGSRYRAAAFVGGLSLIVLGSVIRRQCWRALGDYFTADIQVTRGQRVIADGPYRLVRHPSYSGGILISAGIGFALSSWLSLLVLTLTSIVVYGYRVRIEEQALLEEIGEPYREFMKTRKRFIPFVI